MIPYSRPKHSDLYTLSQSKLLENHTFHSGTYLYSPYMAVPPPGLRDDTKNGFVADYQSLRCHLSCIIRHFCHSMKICAQRKARRTKRARRLCRSFILLPMDPCVSSPATRMSLACRARPCTKNEAPEEEAVFFFL